MGSNIQILPTPEPIQHSWQLVRHIINNSPLSSTQTLVLLYLADHANRDKGWKVWHSVDRIAHHVRANESTVTRATAELCKQGYLRKERIKSIPPRNDYYLNIDAICSMKSTFIAQEQVYSAHTSRFKPCSIRW